MDCSLRARPCNTAVRAHRVCHACPPAAFGLFVAPPGGFVHKKTRLASPPAFFGRFLCNGGAPLRPGRASVCVHIVGGYTRAIACTARPPAPPSLRTHLPKGRGALGVVRPLERQCAAPPARPPPHLTPTPPHPPPRLKRPPPRRPSRRRRPRARRSSPGWGPRCGRGRRCSRWRTFTPRSTTRLCT